MHNAHFGAVIQYRNHRGVAFIPDQQAHRREALGAVHCYGRYVSVNGQSAGVVDHFRTGSGDADWLSGGGRGNADAVITGGNFFQGSVSAERNTWNSDITQ